MTKVMVAVGQWYGALVTPLHHGLHGHLAVSRDTIERIPWRVYNIA